MKGILIVFFIILLGLLISILPFKIRLMSHINLIEAKGFYSLKILFFKILTGRVYMENGAVVAENSVNIISDKMNNDFMKKLTKEILNQIEVKKIEIYFTGGFIDNSFASAILCGGISALIQTIYSFLSQRYDLVELHENVEPTFEENNLELTTDFVISISLFQIFISVLKSAFSSKKVKENKK